MAVQSLHPGVTVKELNDRTAFPVHIPDSISVTPAPTPEDIRVIRDADPLEVRKLELMSGSLAAEKFVRIYERERQTLHATYPRLGKLGR